ncbi:WGR domain-containing protein [Microvirga sp. RSM25]|uniref:WGR domain-containing protein n=1 Tax=Microvirga sp. RSM25 TaxID=3273802 RepID=UPI00384CB764
MPDELRSPIKYHLVLHKRDPERRVARFYSLMMERDLFGTNGQEKVEEFASKIEAGKALRAFARAKRKRGIETCE